MKMEAVILEEKSAAGITVVNGRDYVTNADGGLTPLELIKAEDFLEDQMVRKIVAFAKKLSAEIARFKQHTRADIAEFDRLLEAKYGLVKRGRAGAGNQTYRTIDGLQMVGTRVNSLIDFGPQLQTAKGLIDECLNDWTEDGRREVRGLITRAFNVDTTGQISKSAVFELFKVESDDPRWTRAMEAINAAVRVIGTKEYLHFSYRQEHGGQEIKISINIADA
jgi:hypothetical protein